MFSPNRTLILWFQCDPSRSCRCSKKSLICTCLLSIFPSRSMMLRLIPCQFNSCQSSDPRQRSSVTVSPLTLPVIPELPGYGISTMPPESDKRTVGHLLIAALHKVFQPDRSVIWFGHDRGARIGHRLLVDNDPSHRLQAGILLDIVPTLAQFRSFSHTVAASAYFHWPFLATGVGPKMIAGMGGGNFCRMMLARTVGGNEEGRKKFRDGNSEDVYASLFDRDDCVAGSCADYAAGATVDCEEQERDQQDGRHITLPTLVMYSALYLGRLHDVPAVWRDWCAGEVEAIGVPDAYGHFLPEECPEIVTRHALGWIHKRVGLSESR